MKKLIPLLFLLLAQAAFGQAAATHSGTQDFTNATTRGPHGSTLPATCVVGDHYWHDAAATGRKEYYCEATNTWVLQGDGGASGTPGGSTTQVQFNNGGAFGGDPGMTYDLGTDILATVGGFQVTGGCSLGLVLDCPAQASVGGVLTLKERTGFGTETWKIDLGALNLSVPFSITPQTDGRFFFTQLIHAADSPADEECPTYEATGTTVEWQACSAGSGEVNTASNLGGGLANYSTKVGVDLQFNSFAAVDFDLASNLISIDPTKWLTIVAADAAYQPLDSDLTAIAALVTTSFGRSVLTGADASAVRTLLGVAIGTDVQAFDADLTDLADGSLTGTKVGFADTDNLYTATNLQAAIEELNDSINAGAPNGTGAKVHWSQLLGVPTTIPWAGGAVSYLCMTISSSFCAISSVTATTLYDPNEDGVSDWSMTSTVFRLIGDKFIEFEGATNNTSDSRLGAVDPTGAGIQDYKLPNAGSSGTRILMAVENVSGDATATSNGVLEVTQADALEANGSNCATSGQVAAGVDASGAAEGCRSFSQYPRFTAAGCNVTSAGPGFSIPQTNGPTAGCYGTDPWRNGGLDFVNGANKLTANVQFDLKDWDGGAISVDLVWYCVNGGGTCSTNNVVWEIQTKCVAVTEDFANPTFNGVEQTTTAGSATQNAKIISTDSSLDTTGCAAGETFLAEIGRDPTEASDTQTGTAALLLATFKFGAN